MRLFEIEQPLDPEDMIGAEPETAVQEPVQPGVQQQPVQQPMQPQKPAAKVYASLQQIRNLAKQFEQELPAGSYTPTNKEATKPVPHLRIQKISPAELKQLVQNAGGVMTTPDAKQSKSSGKFAAYAFDINGVSYAAVIGSVKGKDDEAAIGIGRKELSPAPLGLAGRQFNKAQLIVQTKKAVEQKIRDEQLKAALIQLVDIAAAGGVGNLDPELAEHIAPIIGTVSQDFGEILAPILIMDKEDVAEFPAGNSPIIDVRLKKINLSVKALTGSGTSFRTVSDLMDKYEESIIGDPAKKEKYSVLKAFHPKQGGKNVDKIVLSAATAKTPEYRKAVEILGQEFKNYSQLATAIENKIGSGKKTIPYPKFLELIYPAMTAGDWGVPVGLPADGKFYLGQTTTQKKEKAAGKPSYDANPKKGAADIVTYMLGVGLLNMIRRGGDAEVYSSMMTDIVNKANAVLGHITINPDGSMKLDTRPFSDLKFEFQYHAPSHIPGNNLPGFIAILD